MTYLNPYDALKDYKPSTDRGFYSSRSANVSEADTEQRERERLASLDRTDHVNPNNFSY